ncbi:MAG: TonB-dependent receptor, partial [Cycloclasticus sp.]
ILTGANGIAASLTVGVELIDSQNDRLEYQDETNTAIAEDENIDMTVSAPFAQLELMPTEKAKITLGLRYEDVEYDVKDNIDASRDQVRTFDAWTPKFGFSYDIDVDHKVFGGISKGFAPPSRNKMFQGTYENSNLEAELATNYELGVRGVFVDQAVTYDVAIYNLEVKDFIVDEYVETVAGRDKFRPVNAGEVNFRGLEAQLEYDPLEYLSFAVSYTYARNQFIDYVDDGNDYSGNFLSSSPKHHINARITLIPAEDFQIELEMDSISSYYTNNANDADSEGRYDRDDLFNLRVNYEQGPVELWASALNLTDEKYATRVSYSTRSGGSRSFRVGDARTLYFGAAYNF